MKFTKLFIASVFIFALFQTISAQLVLDGKKFVKFCNGHASHLPQPKYLRSADYSPRTQGESVSVVVLINEKGEVELANAVTGNPFLRPGAEVAALSAKFRTSFKAPKKVSCVLTFVIKPENFEELEKENEANKTDKKPRICTGGVCNSRATYFPQPVYPKEAKEQNISGTVSVRVSIDEEGNVTSAEVCGGHPLLREEARKVALKAKFKQTKLSGVPVKVSCMLAYTFLPDKSKQTKQTEEPQKPYIEPPIISLGVVNDKAKVLPMPITPTGQPQSDGSINVEVKIDLQKGKIISAMAFEGHSLIRDAAVKAAMQAEFEPTLTEFPTIYGKGTLVYKIEDVNGKITRNGNPRPLVKVIKGGIINGMATDLPEPEYPEEAKRRCAGGIVEVLSLVYMADGKLISAKAISSDEFLKEAAQKAALKTKFSSPNINGDKDVYIKGKLVYNFDSFVNCNRGDSRSERKSIKEKEPVTIGHPPPNTEPIFAPQPEYPEAARVFNISGKVVVKILIDEEGNVEEAKISSGHPMLRNSALKAAGQTKFEPILLSEKPVKVRSTLVYHFKP